MTKIHDDVKIIEGINQSYSKLYVNNDKELHFIDSSGTDTSLSNNNNVQIFDGYLKRVYTLQSVVNMTSSGTFITYTIPANTLNVGSAITVLVSGNVLDYSSGSGTFRTFLNGTYLLADTDSNTPANGWQFYGHGSATILSTGVSGSIARGGIGIFGLSYTKYSTTNIPFTLSEINTIDTTQDITISVACEIGGSMTLQLRQFIVTVM